MRFLLTFMALMVAFGVSSATPNVRGADKTCKSSCCTSTWPNQDTNLPSSCDRTVDSAPSGETRKTIHGIKLKNMINCFAWWVSSQYWHVSVFVNVIYTRVGHPQVPPNLHFASFSSMQ